VAIEIVPERIALAKHNARIYGVEDRIEFVLGDAMSVLAGMRPGSADVVFLSPPWGGMDYTREGFDVVRDIQLRGGSRPANGQELFRACKRITPNVAVFLPRQVDRAKMAQSFGPCTEVETHVLKGRDATVCAYFGEWFVL
jgi:trimethylguanosine synthase